MKKCCKIVSCILVMLCIVLSCNLPYVFAETSEITYRSIQVIIDDFEGCSEATKAVDIETSIRSVYPTASIEWKEAFTVVKPQNGVRIMLGSQRISEIKPHDGSITGILSVDVDNNSYIVVLNKTLDAGYDADIVCSKSSAIDIKNETNINANLSYVSNSDLIIVNSVESNIVPADYFNLSLNTQIKAVVFRSGINNVKDNALKGNGNNFLSAVVFEKYVTYISSAAFQNNPDLKYVELGNGSSFSIGGSGAFQANPSLQQLYLAYETVNFGVAAFAYNSNFSSIMFESKSISLGTSAFKTSNKTLLQAVCNNETAASSLKSHSSDNRTIDVVNNSFYEKYCLIKNIASINPEATENEAVGIVKAEIGINDFSIKKTYDIKGEIVFEATIPYNDIDVKIDIYPFKSGYTTKIIVGSDNNNFNGNVPKGFFIPYGSAIQNGKYLKKNADGTFYSPAGNVVVTYFTLPKINGISTFGSSSKSYLKTATKNSDINIKSAIQFGTYIDDATNKDCGTVLIRDGDVSKISLIEDYSQFVSKYEETLGKTNSNGVTFKEGMWLSAKIEGEKFTFMRVKQEKHMWKGENGELQYVVRIYGLRPNENNGNDYTNTYFTAIGYAVDENGNYQFSENIKTSKFNGVEKELMESSTTYSEYINYRTDLSNTYYRLNQDKELNVVYFGGSVTDGYGSTSNDKYSWRGLVNDWLTKNFPDATINKINSAEGESGTYLASYRTQRDIIAHNPDLVFIEYSINDRYFQSANPQFTDDDAASQYETIVREIKEACPNCDIVTLYVTDKAAVSDALEGIMHSQANAHEEIAIAYDIPSLKIGCSLANQLYSKHGDKYLTDDVWNNYFLDTVHPLNAGYELYYNTIREYLYNQLFCTYYSEPIVETVVPELQSNNLFDGNRQIMQINSNMLERSIANGGKGFVYNSDLYGMRSYYGYASANVDTTLSENDYPIFAIEFNGTDLAIHTNIKKYACQYYVQIDNGEWEKRNFKSHNPIVLAENLSSGTHIVRFKPDFSTFTSDYSVLKIGLALSRDVTKQTTK